MGFVRNHNKDVNCHRANHKHTLTTVLYTEHKFKPFVVTCVLYSMCKLNFIKNKHEFEFDRTKLQGALRVWDSATQSGLIIFKSLVTCPLLLLFVLAVASSVGDAS